MADLPQYTGVTYDSTYSRNPEETMYDYMQRLASQRASGVLGGGGMLDTPAAEVTSAPLGQVTQNCPAGYVLRNGACVPVGSTGGEYEAVERRSPEQLYRDILEYKANPNPLFSGGWIGLLAKYGNDYTQANLREKYPDMTARMDEEFAMSRPVEVQEKKGFFDGLKDGITDLTGGIVDAIVGINTPEQQAAIPVTTSLGSVPAHMLQAKTFPAQMPQVPTVVTDRESLIGPTFGSGMLSNDGTTYTSSYGNTYDFSSMSPQTQYGLSITDNYNDGSFGD